MRKNLFTATAWLLCAALLALTCSQPEAADSDSVTLVLRFGVPGGTSRTVVPDLGGIVDQYVVSLVDGHGATHSETVPYTAGGTELTLNGIYPGSCIVTVTAQAVNANNGFDTVGSGTVTVNLSPGSNEITVPVTITGTGNGTLAFAFNWTAAANLGVTDVGWSLKYGNTTTASGSLTANEIIACSGTITATLAPGTYTLTLVFYKDSSVLGTFVEAVTIVSGQTTNRWIGPDGDLLEERAFEESDFVSDSAELTSLTLAGGSFTVTTTESIGTLGPVPYATVTIQPVFTGGYVTASYKWNNGSSVAITSGEISTRLTLNGTGTNDLVLTLVSPAGGESIYEYSVSRGYTVTYVGTGADGGNVPPQTVHEAGTTIVVQDNPGTLTRSDDLLLAGWNTDQNSSQVLPTLTANADITLHPVWGEGIDSPEALETIELNGTYVLTGDIDLEGETGFPLGTIDAPFTGTLDGGGYEISGLALTTGNIGRGGLFTLVGQGAVIENVYLVDINITTNSTGYTGDTTDCYNGLDYDGSFTGGLAAANYGTIRHCYVTGIIYGTGQQGRIGGIVGGNRPGGLIEECYSEVVISAQTNDPAHPYYDIGSLVGSNWGTVRNCYTRGNVMGGQNVGGFIGENVTGSQVQNCYSTGFVNSSGASGGFTGNFDGSVSASYYDSATSGRSDSIDGIPKTTAEMTTQGTFAGWDFIGVWGISASVNEGYPYLRFF